MAAPTTLRLVDPENAAAPLDPAEIDLGGSEATGVSIDEDGIGRIEHPDGSVTFDENPDSNKAPKDEGDFYRNLAGDIDESALAKIANELLTGIELDDQSRTEWLNTRATGIRLLGLKLEEPRSDIGASSAPLDGMSSVRHPLLLEATIRFQATARGELLPSAGPVKVRNDLPMRPDSPAPPPMPPPGSPGPMPPGAAAPPQSGPMPAPPPAPPPPALGHNGGPPLAPEGEALDELGSALEKDMNHYLTVTATEYVPDTDRMLFYVGFGGDGFKKVYNCPLRRRPVSESVDAEDIIVSNAATDIRNCGRVTHRIKMRPSILKRMQIIGAYRDVKLSLPNAAERTTPAQQEKANIAGHKPQPQRSEDADYTVYEVYCELDIAEFAPEQFKAKALPLPYVVTIEKDSRQVLAVARNWDKDDEQCLSKQFFVQFPFIRGLGFYGIGLIHILGNVTMTLTAAWREMLDNGMFANFPGFLYAKQAGRQLTNQFRVPPGGGVPIDIGAGMKLADMVMPLPYKETGAAFTGFITHVEEVGQRLGQTADINVGEGKQDVPVGTTMALIEQATKTMDSVHKRLHAAQAEEFGLLKERFREDPEAFWRHNKKPARKWTIEQFKAALEQRELVPVADPNNPTSLHRIAKAMLIDTLVSKYPQLMNAQNALKRIMRIADVDAEGLLNAQPAPPPPDPRFAAIEAKAKAQEQLAQIAQAKVHLQAVTAAANMQDKQKEREFKERMQQFEMQLEAMRVHAEQIIHSHDLQNEAAKTNAGIATEHLQAVHGAVMDHAKHQQELAHGNERHQHDMAAEQARTGLRLTAEQQRHAQQMSHTDDKHDADIAHKRALAAMTPKTGEK